VVWGPIKDMSHISHGPVGCGQYSWAARRNYYIGTTGVDSFVTMQFTSDFQEKDIVFGGDKKLEKIIDEIEVLFPLINGITIQSECPIGLIGDDIEAVSKKNSKEHNGKTIVPVRCEGFRGVSQSLGHHIANDTIRDWVFDKKTGKPIETTPYDVAIIGDYNIGGDAWSSRILLEEMGLRVVAQWSGDGSIEELINTPKVKLNVLHCYRSMNYISRHMEEKYGIPWVEYNFFGPSKIAESLRKIAAFFDDTIKENAEKVIAKYSQPPYVQASPNSTPGTVSFPFVDIDNKVIMSGATYSPGILAGASWSQIGATLDQPSNPIAQAIIGTSNYISAAICDATGGHPGNVCSSSGVQAAAKALKLK
jgi:nitrogenase molybdenum-iron protein alpha chain